MCSSSQTQSAINEFGWFTHLSLLVIVITGYILYFWILLPRCKLSNSRKATVQLELSHSCLDAQGKRGEMPVAWARYAAVFNGAWTSKKSRRGKNLRDKRQEMKTKDKSNWPTPVECGEKRWKQENFGCQWEEIQARWQNYWCKESNKPVKENLGRGNSTKYASHCLT